MTKTTHTKYLLILLLNLLFLVGYTTPTSAQLKMMVQGTVVDAKTKDPIKGVQVFDMAQEYTVLATTDSEGGFLISVPPTAELKFIDTKNNYNDLVQPIKGNNNVIVRLFERSIDVGVVIVKTEAPKNRVGVEKTDIEIRGDYFYLQTAFRIPFALFKSDQRFIFQPVIHDVSRDIKYNMRPVVVDGENYARLIDRHLEFDEKADKLAKYRINFDGEKQGDKVKVEVYPYSDSMYVDVKDRENGFKSDCYLALASLKPPFDYKDSVLIAKGTRNVLRFFEYKLHPMKLDGTIIKTLDEIDDPLSDKCDPDLIPRPRLSSLSSKGTAKITFAVNKTTIDESIKENKESLDKIKSTMEMVRTNPNATLQSVSMVGYASPEGDLAKNQALADARTATIFKTIRNAIDPRLLPFVELSYKGAVQPWSALIDIIEPENPELSKKIADIIAQTKDNYAKSQAMIARLPEYRTDIRTKYLPLLRKVEYTIDYSVLREYTQEEMEVRLEQNVSGDGEQLAKYEYYKMICNIKDRKKREYVEDQAMKAYPDFVWVSNRVSVRNIIEQKATMDLLKDIVTKKDVQRSSIFNQALSALQDHDIHAADSLMFRVPNRIGLEYPVAVISALNGDYDKAYPVLSPEGGLNQVLLLMGMKRVKEAFDIVSGWMQSPENQYNTKYLYIFATCVNRLNDANLLGVAVNFLSTAIMLDPKMETYAQVDSDLAIIYDTYKAQMAPSTPATSGGTGGEVTDGKKKKGKAPKELTPAQKAKAEAKAAAAKKKEEERLAAMTPEERKAEEEKKAKAAEAKAAKEAAAKAAADKKAAEAAKKAAAKKAAAEAKAAAAAKKEEDRLAAMTPEERQAEADKVAAAKAAAAKKEAAKQEAAAAKEAAKNAPKAKKAPKEKKKKEKSQEEMNE